MPSRFPFAIAALACAFAGSGDAHAQTQLELSGNARFQIGGGLPVPITGAPPPDGRVQAHSAALARQTTGPDPKRLSFASGQLTAPGNTLVLGLFANNPNLFQIQTNVAVQLPNGPAAFSAGGRTGLPVTTVTGLPHIGGLIRYSATSSQFGGVAAGRFNGMATIAINAGNNNPAAGDCTNLATNACTVVLQRSMMPQTRGLGVPLGSTVQTVVMGSRVTVLATVSPGGRIGAYLPFVTTFPISNAVRSVGGPWTTGRVTISHPGATPQLFTITGSDGRVNGSGSLSLVAGSLSQRSFSGPNANRGWLNLNVTELPEPTAGLCAAAALAALLVGHAAMRRRR